MSNQATVDLTNCDTEPIHIPGAVQSHGVILALAEPELTITQVSANTTELLGIRPEALLGEPLGSLLNPANMRYLQQRVFNRQLEGAPSYFPAMQVGNSPVMLEGVAHRFGGLLLLEFELPPEDEQLLPTELYSTLKEAVNQLDLARDVTSFCQIAAEQVREFTGFDRVMVYQFREDDSGRVVAEALRDGMESFMGLHYPASDIPKQARALYLKSWLRIKRDVADHGVPLVPLINPYTNAPLDLSYAVIRTMSPIHMEYLRNMGVCSTMSISIVKNNKLWGLLACHHETPRALSHAVRAACELLAHTISTQIDSKESAEQQTYRNHLTQMHTQFVQQMAVGETYQDGLLLRDRELLNWIDTGGVALCGATTRLLGITPSEAQVQRLVAWLIENVEEPVFATHDLSSVYPEADSFLEQASGLLAVRLSRFRSEYILWFRPEYKHQINWAGDPTKPAVVGPLGTRLTPRASFALWQQEIRGKAAPWQPFEIEMASQLRRSILEIVVRHMEELSRMNVELERSNAELDSFAYVASHDLKEPLRGINNYAHFLLEDFADTLQGEGADNLRTIIRLTQRMESLIESLLHFSRLGRTELILNEANLQAELDDVLILLGVRIAEKQVEIRVPEPLPVVRANRSQIGEVFSNLISNAIKYNKSEHPWVEIRYEQTQLQPDAPQVYLFSIADNGIGIAPSYHDAIFRIFKRLHERHEYGGGVGAGLTIVRKIVERHGGAVWLESTPGEGTTFFFTLPV